MAARSFLGAGDILLERIVGGVGQGLEGPYKANKLGLQPAVETRQSTSKGRYDYGQTLESVNLQQPTTLTLELKEVVGAVLAMALMGTSAALAQASGTLVDEAVAGKKGKWVSVAGKLNLAETVVVEHQNARTGTYAATGGNTGNFTCSAVTVAAGTRAGVYTGTLTAATAFTIVGPAGTVGSGTFGSAFSTGGLGFTITAGGTPGVAGDSFTITVVPSGSDSTLVEGTDFKLNRPLGLIMLLPGSTAPEDTVFKVSGAYSGTSGTRISGGTQSEVRVRIVFDGINMADGTECTAEVFEAVLATESEFDFLPDDFGVVTLSGNCKTPVGKDAPYIVDLKALPT